VRELEELGPGLPQYFWLVKYLVGVMGVTWVLAGLPALIDFAVADHYEDWDRNSNWAIVVSAGNKGDRRIRETILPLWQSILHIVAMALVLLSYLFAKRWLSAQEDVITSETITASDYTVWIKGLPKDYKNADLVSYLERAGRADGRPCSIHKVNVPIDIREFVSAVKEVNRAKRNLLLLERQGRESGCCGAAPQSKEALEAQMQSALSRAKAIEALYSAQEAASRRLPMAFVTFKTQEDARLVCDNLGTNAFQRFFHRVCGQGSFESEEFHNTRIHGFVPPDPSDILWENLSVRLVHRLKNMALTSAVTLVMLGLCGGMIYGCSYYKHELYKDYRDQTDTGSADRVRFLVTSILPAIGVIVINLVLARSIRLFSLYERPHTYTLYHSSVALKLVFAMCINTALITILVDYDRDTNWFTPGGLAVEMTYIYISNAVVGPLLYVFSPGYIFRVIRRCRIRRAPERFFQGDANAVFEGPPLDLAQRYASVFKTLIISFAYAPIVPIGLGLGLFALLIEYWVDKALLLRRHARPLISSGDLNRSMVRLLPWAVVVYAVMLYVFMELLNSDDSTAAFIWMWITIGIALFPTSFYRICWKRQWETLKRRAGDTQEFEEVALSFLDDFDRANPVTQREGWEAYMRLAEKRKLLDQKLQEELLKQIRTAPGLLGDYGKAFGNWQSTGMARREWGPAQPLQSLQKQMLQYFAHPGRLTQLQTISHQKTSEAQAASVSATGAYSWTGQVHPQPPPPIQPQSWAVPYTSQPVVFQRGRH